MKNVYFIIGFLLWSNNSFGMEIVKISPVNQQAGLFDLLSKDITKPIFASLHPKQINCLRRSCKKWSTLFSFYNPSLEFVLYKNPHISQKDLESIFITAVYDGKHEIVKALLQGERIHRNYFYEIPTISGGLFPYCVAEINKDKDMAEILKDFNHESQIWNDEEDKGITFYIPNQMLIACISRNSARVRESIKIIKNINEIEFSLWWHILIANKDNRSLLAIFQNIQISEDMKHMGNQLIEHAHTCHNSVAVKILLKRGCYDDLNKITMESLPRWVSQEDFTRSLQCKTLLDRILNTNDYDNSPHRERIYNLLRKHGAKTAEEEFFQDKDKKKTEKKCYIQ